MFSLICVLGLVSIADVNPPLLGRDSGTAGERPPADLIHEASFVPKLQSAKYKPFTTTFRELKKLGLYIFSKEKILLSLL